MRQLIVSFFLLLFAALAYASESPAVAMDAFKKSVIKYGLPRVEGVDKAGDKTVPALYFGRRKMNNNTNIVDNLKKSKGGTATIFVKDGDEFVRITTNVLKDDGTRGLGTNLAHNKAYDAARNGEKYCGELDVLGAIYNTCYEPIKDASGLTLGLFFVGYKKQ